MLVEEFAESRTETIGERLVIDVVDQFVGREMVGVEKDRSQTGRHSLPYKIADQLFADGAAAAFVTQDKAKRVYVLDDPATIIDTGIATCAQDGSKAGFVAKQRPGRGKRIVFYVA